jgi:hypothetical protein
MPYSEVGLVPNHEASISLRSKRSKAPVSSTLLLSRLPCSLPADRLLCRVRHRSVDLRVGYRAPLGFSYHRQTRRVFVVPSTFHDYRPRTVLVWLWIPPPTTIRSRRLPNESNCPIYIVCLSAAVYIHRQIFLFC